MNVNDGPSFSYAAISEALTGDNTISAGVSGKAILVWKIMNVVAGITSLTIKDGAAVNLTGAIPMVANGSMTLPFDEAPWFKTSPGNGFVINSSGIAVQQSGVVVYSLSPANVQP